MTHQDEGVAITIPLASCPRPPLQREFLIVVEAVGQRAALRPATSSGSALGALLRAKPRFFTRLKTGHDTHLLLQAYLPFFAPVTVQTVVASFTMPHPSAAIRTPPRPVTGGEIGARWRLGPVSARVRRGITPALENRIRFRVSPGVGLIPIAAISVVSLLPDCVVGDMLRLPR
jgi:hypothetical protein